MARLVEVIAAITVVASVSSGAPIQDRNSEFSCCDLTVNYSHDLSCEDIWSSNEGTIAIMSSDTRSCESPCKKIKTDRLILDRCVNVTVATVCTANGVIKETRTIFHSQMCPLRFTNGNPTGNQGSVVLLLLAFMTGQLLRFIS